MRGELKSRPYGSCTDRHQVRFCGGPDLPIFRRLLRLHELAVMPEDEILVSVAELERQHRRVLEVC
jgi:hypothetical protein